MVRPEMLLSFVDNPRFPENPEIKVPIRNNQLLTLIKRQDHQLREDGEQNFE